MSNAHDPRAGATGKDRDTAPSLLLGLLANKPEDWRRFVHLYNPLVYHWCARNGVQGADAEDVWQEVCRAVVTGLGNFRKEHPGDTFRGWLRGITKNLIALHYRQKGRHPQASGGTDAQLRLHAIADPQIDLPDEDSPEERTGLHRLSRVGFLAGGDGGAGRSVPEALAVASFAPGTPSNSANWRCYFWRRSVLEVVAVASVAPEAPSNVAKKAKGSKARPCQGRVFWLSLSTPRCSTKGSCLQHGPYDLIGKELGQAQQEKPTLERAPPAGPGAGARRV
jgi:RNA polymerase sigma factor (sigma-70 family)